MPITDYNHDMWESVSSVIISKIPDHNQINNKKFKDLFNNNNSFEDSSLPKTLDFKSFKSIVEIANEEDSSNSVCSKDYESLDQMLKLEKENDINIDQFKTP